MQLAKALKTGAFNPTAAIRSASSSEPTAAEPLNYEKYSQGLSEPIRNLLGEKGKVEQEAKAAHERYAPQKEQAQRQVIETQKNVPSLPEFKELPEFKPSKIDEGLVRNTIGGLMALAMLGGAMSKQSGTAAVKAMTGVLEGWEAGDKERFTKEAQIYDRNQRAIVAQNNRLQEQYKNALAKHSGDIQSAMNELHIIAMKEGDELMAFHAKKGNISEVIKLQQDAERAKAANEQKQQSLALQWAKLRQDQKQHEERMGEKEKKSQAKLNSPVTLKGKALESWSNNYAAIEAIDKILSLPEGRIDSSMGLKSLLPNQVLNRIFPEGVGDRATILDLSNIQLKNRSGAAVTDQEFKRAQVALPTKGDDENSIRSKLGSLRNFTVSLNNAMLVQPHELSTEPPKISQQEQKKPIAYAEYGGKKYVKYADGSVEEQK